MERPKLIDSFLPKVEELVETSEGAVRADVVHERLVGLGFSGMSGPPAARSRRSSRLIRDGHRRQYRPWITEPGLWLQFDHTCIPFDPESKGGSEATTLEAPLPEGL